ncbi:MAG: DUF4352 domain-containing protein [Methanomicrobia archaeon]|nr:DUF4352 domain-containing protein [Methanomicrobia archaeon]
MKSRIICIGIILLVAFSLCISDGSETQTPEKTETPEITETPEKSVPTTPPASTTQFPTPAPTTPAPTPPGKKELVINEEKTQNNIVITISKLYYVNEPKYGNSGPLEDHLRVELSIRNDSESTIEFYPNITSVIEDDLKNQYVVLSMPSSKEWGEINPEETREGYITFPRIDENAETITIVLRNDTTAIEFLIDMRNL